MKRTSILRGIGVALMLTLAGFGAQSVSAEELRIAVASEPPTMDTVVTTQIQAGEPMRNVFETLLTLDSDNNVRAMLADTFEQSADGLTITFTLRKDVPFHDGTTMTANDVVASMRRWSEFSSAGQTHTPGATWEAKDENTVVLTLSAPNGLVLIDLAYNSANLPGIMPARIAEAAGKEEITEYVGTGPFVLEAWNRGQNLVLKKFENYAARSEPADGTAGDRTPHYDTITYHYVADASTILLGIESGEYDVAKDFSFDDVSRLKSSGINIGVAPRTGLLNLYFNKAEGLFADVRARQAVNIGIDRMNVLLGSYVSEDYFDITSDFMGAALDAQWDSSIGREGFGVPDVEKAKALLAEAGYNGEKIRILTSVSDGAAYRAALVVQEELTKLGVDAVLDVYDSATKSQRRSDKTAWELVLITNQTKVEPTQLTFFRSSFPGWTSDPKVTELLAGLMAAPSLDEAKTHYDGLQQWFVDYLPVIKLGDVSEVYAYRPEVTGIDALDPALIVWSARPAQ